MTRTCHDLFAKQHLEALLEPLGTVRTSRKVASETREVDVWFVLAVLQINLNTGQNLSRDERALAMNLTPVYEQWRKETLQQGRQEGIQLGLQQGERSLILRQLSRRVGMVSPEVISQVEALPLHRLEALGEALLDFANADDLMVWLKVQ